MRLLFKLFGSALVIISTFSLGYSKALEYKNRVKYLQSMQDSIIQLENEIRYTKTPVSLAFKKISAGAHPVIKNIFEYTYARANEFTGELMSDIWTEAIVKNSSLLHDDDSDLFISFSNFLGENDIDGQLNNINLFEEKIISAIQKADELCTSNIKLYKNLGLYTGILITVLLL